MCECPALGKAREWLVKAYHHHLAGLPCMTLQDLLHSTGYVGHRCSALAALLNFLEDTSLTERLL